MILKILSRRKVLIIVISVIFCNAFLSLFVERGTIYNLIGKQSDNNNYESLIDNNNMTSANSTNMIINNSNHNTNVDNVNKNIKNDSLIVVTTSNNDEEETRSSSDNNRSDNNNKTDDEDFLMHNNNNNINNMTFFNSTDLINNNKNNTNIIDNLNISDSLITTSNNNENEEEETRSNKNINSAGYKNGMIKQYLYRNPWIIKNGCVMTVVLLDPNLGSSVFFSLESVAKNVHPINETCIVIQTSLCRIQKEYKLEMTLASYDEAYIILTDTIYNSSKPLFRKLIELGNVRVSIFNHTKYQTNNCQDFRSVNAPFFNINFWSNYCYIDSNGNKITMNSNTSDVTIIDTGFQITISDDNMNNQLLVLNGEFVHQQDSDFILVIQNDAVLCHGLDVYSWNQFPYVGAPWGTGYFCNKFKGHWDKWHTLASGYNESISTIPDYPIDMCNDPDVSPLGNGGLSLRSRYWMREAIRYCPQITYSGLSEQERQGAACLLDSIRYDSQEDVYYGMLLRGMFFNRKNITSHKMPTVLDAALFATESRYYMDFYDNLKIAPEYSIEANVRDRWWIGQNGTRGNINTDSFHEGWERFQRMQKIYIESNKTMPIVPIGYHAVNKYDASKIKWAYQHILQECPYLIGVLPSKFIDEHLQNVSSTIP